MGLCEKIVVLSKYNSPLTPIECTRCDIRVYPEVPSSGSVIILNCNVCGKNDKLIKKVC